jgi:hypothetical protein
VPVTAKLPRKFYETFGDDITNELVEWLNQVDASYRAEFREFNETTTNGSMPDWSSVWRTFAQT